MSLARDAREARHCTLNEKARLTLRVLKPPLNDRFIVRIAFTPRQRWDRPRRRVTVL